MYSELNLKLRYSSENDNIGKDFYEPVLKKSSLYLRTSGFFSSKILRNYLAGLRDFYLNGGKMKMIVSPNLTEEDIEVFNKLSSDELNSKLTSLIERELLNLFDDENVASTTLLFNLIRYRILEIRFAVTKNPIGMYHEKTALFFSKNSRESIAIQGSNNETESAILNNQESFCVFSSWKEGTKEYIDDILKSFNKVWENRNDNLVILNLEEAKFEDVFAKIEPISDIEAMYNNLNNMQVGEQKDDYLFGLNFEPYDYQKEAVEILLEKKRGILKFATGSGKTKTTIYFIERLKQLRQKTFFIVVVPDKTLVNQWYSELTNTNNRVLKVFSDNPGWRYDLRDMIQIYKHSEQSNQVVVTTSASMFLNEQEGTFLKLIQGFDDFVFIVDECHHFNTDRILRNLPDTEYRIGLSATPESTIPSDNSEKMIEYFEGIAAEYSLADAIRDGKLVPYNYYPIEVELTVEEMEKYRDLTAKIIRIRSVLENNYSKELDLQVQRLLFVRSWIIYGAKNKIGKLEELLANGTIQNEDLLIYCGPSVTSDESDEDSLTQLEDVMKLMYEKGLNAYKYTSKEDARARENALALFKTRTISPLVAIKCLDEGVDIPSIRNAVILASTNSSREFVQRRGRILRLSEGKEIANIYDFIVRDYEDLTSGLNIRETSRLIEYVSDAKNKEDIYREQEIHIQIWEEYEDERKRNRANGKNAQD